MSKHTIHKINAGTAAFPYTLILNRGVTIYNLHGARDMTLGPIAIDAKGGRAAERGDLIVVLKNCALTNYVIATNSLTILGVEMPAAYATKDCTAVAIYDGAAWVTGYLPDFSQVDVVGTLSILDGAIINAKILDATILLTKLTAFPRGSVVVGDATGRPALIDAKANGRLLGGNGTDLVLHNLSTEGFFAVGDSAGGLTPGYIAEQMPSRPADFTAAATFKIPTNCKGTITKIYVVVETLIEATNDGSITFKNNAGVAMGPAALAVTKASVQGTVFTFSPTTNNTFITGDIIQCTMAKVTPGGTVTIFPMYTRTSAY